MALEIERKFLVRIVGDPVAEEGVRTLELLQEYLVDDGTGMRRVRRTDDGEDVRYHTAAKRDIAPGVREEVEREIAVAEWSELRRAADPERHAITKTRYVVPSGRHTWEIDVFGGRLRGLALAEVEFATEAGLEDEVEPPDCIVIERDVTDDARYGNAALARLDAPPAD
jgi:CYTH domain-containing protein